MAAATILSDALERADEKMHGCTRALEVTVISCI
jgi:hypothetical protein